MGIAVTLYAVDDYSVLPKTFFCIFLRLCIYFISPIFKVFYLCPSLYDILFLLHTN